MSSALPASLDDLDREAARGASTDVERTGIVTCIAGDDGVARFEPTEGPAGHCSDGTDR